MESPASALARVVVARREQLAFRVGLAVAVAVVCHALTGWQIALIWVAAYVAVQLGEQRLFSDVSTAADLTPGRTRAVLAAISAGTLVFSAFGLLQSIYYGRGGLHAPRWCGPARS